MGDPTDITIEDTVEKPRLSHTKATRNDWLTAARDRLVSAGVGDVKILTLAQHLGVARSSFYWYFADRADLLDALLADWEARNTRCIVEKCEQPAKSISEALCNFFACFVDPQLFDHGLDFAIREWSRRDTELRQRVDAADTARIASVTAMFVNHGYETQDADARARILYFMQLGYHALEVNEPMDIRMSRIEGYLLGFTGRPADNLAVEEFKNFALSLGLT
ncbi:MAG: TetR/AcrR family transcriptional regulator [Pseudomonadota bacterium]